MGNSRYEVIGWNLLPDTLLLSIFAYLDFKQLVTVSEVCWHWARISKDNFLWKRRFALHFSVNTVRTALSSCNEDGSWLSEYTRLVDDFPQVESETISQHVDEVLHVSFSSDGAMFSTCSKDCTLKIWQLSNPCALLCDKDLSEMFHWKYTQFSKFNADDSLILVSGVHVGPNTPSGEIAVFEIKEHDLEFRCRVMNKPYDMFGCWYDNDHVLNGELHWISQASSTSDIYLCAASQEVESERKSVIARLFRFFNRNASTLHMTLVSSHVSPWLRYAVDMTQKFLEAEKKGVPFELNLPSADEYCGNDEKMTQQQEQWEASAAATSCSMEGRPDKLFIFCTGQLTYTPHQVGFKLLRGRMIGDLFDEEVMPPERARAVMERIRVYRTSLNNANASGGDQVEVDGDGDSGTSDDSDHSSMDNDAGENAAAEALPGGQQQPGNGDELSWQELMEKFDFADHVVEMHGHVVGMSLTDDERYLFVNVRPWPDGCVVSNPYEPPPIAQQIEVRVIDLETLSLLDIRYRAHKGFTPSDECFFIFLDSCDRYVASGSEDSYAYVWDRHYGCLVGKLPHASIVNSVAFHPKNSSLLISASDDHTIKVWRSKSTMRALSTAEHR